MIRVEQVIDLSWNTSSSYAVVLSILSSVTGDSFDKEKHLLLVNNNTIHYM